MNWVHVQNLVQAHMLAAEALTMAKGYVAVSVLRHPCPHLYSPPPLHAASKENQTSGVPGSLGWVEASESIISSSQ